MTKLGLSRVGEPCVFPLSKLVAINEASLLLGRAYAFSTRIYPARLLPLYRPEAPELTLPIRNEEPEGARDAAERALRVAIGKDLPRKCRLINAKSGLVNSHLAVEGN